MSSSLPGSSLCAPVSKHSREAEKVAAGGGGGVLPYMGYIGMYGPKGYGFSAVLVINRVSVFGSGPHTHAKFFWEYPPGSSRTWSRPLTRICKY